MCGRARLPADYSEIKIQLKLSDLAPAPNWRPSWNIAPTQDILAVVHDGDIGGRAARPTRWGLVPSWSKDAKPRYATFNARAETVATSPAFRGAWKARRRCLIVTDGFYEWRKCDRQPYAIGRADGRLTVMAGLWETWRSPEGERIVSSTIVTTEANAMMRELHDRMPVVLDDPDWPHWLGEVEEADAAEVQSLLRPCAPELLTAWPVSKRVGNVRNNDPSLAERAGGA